jgi:hypothetical protein
VAEQVLDGVKGRGRVRLDADLVGGVEIREVQRGHDGDQAGAGGLMAADLDAVAGVPVMVGGVDDAGRQPQHAPLDRVQDIGVGGGLGHPRCGVGHVLIAVPACGVVNWP